MFNEVKADANYPNVRDYNDKYFLPEAAVSKSWIYPYEVDKIISLKKVPGIFTPMESRELIELCEKEGAKGRDDFYKGGERKFYVDDFSEKFKVKFYEGKVQSIEQSRLNDSVKKLAIIAIERLAEELNWEKTVERHLGCGVVGYTFTEGSDEPLFWHSDVFAKHSFIILLSDPNDPKNGWKGGDLLYTGARNFVLSDISTNQMSDLMDAMRKTKGAIGNDPNYPVWQITPSCNDGILFGNEGMQHKVTAMAPLNEVGSRIIFTLFDYGV